MAAARKAAKPSPARTVTPLELCLPYQRRYVEDTSRFKIALWARQCGKSYSSSLEAVIDCSVRKSQWLMVAAGERQALEWIRQCKLHVDAFDIALDTYLDERARADEVKKSVSEIRFSNGSRIVACPANPDTIRGYSANVVLDEFAKHPAQVELWRALFPSVSSTLKGRLKLRVLSTPSSLNDKFSEIWFKGGERWSRHKVTIHDAVAQGLPDNREELREALNDEDGWRTEYECAFSDQSSVLLGYDLLARCESEDAATSQDDGFWDEEGRNLYMGIDFGRHKNLTCAWTIEEVRGIGITREVLILHGLDTPAQIEFIAPRVKRCRRVFVDYTGPGTGFGDILAAQFGSYNPDNCEFGLIGKFCFSTVSKSRLFSGLKLNMERNRIRIPIHRDIREDLHSVYKVILPGGSTSYKAHNTPDGHADRCTALALAVKAMDSNAMTYSATLI